MIAIVKCTTIRSKFKNDQGSLLLKWKSLQSSPCSEFPTLAKPMRPIRVKIYQHSKTFLRLIRLQSRLQTYKIQFWIINSIQSLRFLIIILSTWIWVLLLQAIVLGWDSKIASKISVNRDRKTKRSELICKTRLSWMKAYFL